MRFVSKYHEQINGNLVGTSVSELPVVAAKPSDIGSVIAASPIFGGVMETPDHIEFVLNSEQARVVNSARLVAKDTLKGSSVTTPRGEGASAITYTWTARRIDPDNPPL